VIVHEASTTRMDFKAKNFHYVTKDFGDFMAAASAGDNVYLRTTSARHHAERPACLEDDFPSLSPDFVLPPELSLVSDKSAFFSSVLRIQGNVSSMQLQSSFVASSRQVQPGSEDESPYPDTPPGGPRPLSAREKMTDFHCCSVASLRRRCSALSCP